MKNEKSAPIDLYIVSTEVYHPSIHLSLSLSLFLSLSPLSNGLTFLCSSFNTNQILFFFNPLTSYFFAWCATLNLKPAMSVSPPIRHLSVTLWHSVFAFWAFMGGYHIMRGYFRTCPCQRVSFKNPLGWSISATESFVVGLNVFKKHPFTQKTQRCLFRLVLPFNLFKYLSANSFGF